MGHKQTIPDSPPTPPNLQGVLSYSESYENTSSEPADKMRYA